MRFSVTFDDISSLLDGVNKFIDDVNKGNIKCFGHKYCILRIKNGFSDCNKWKSLNEAEYCDIKLNIIYNNPNDLTKCMIIEAQFLVKFLLKAKKIGMFLFCFVLLCFFFSFSVMDVLVYNCMCNNRTQILFICETIRIY